PAAVTFSRPVQSLDTVSHDLGRTSFSAVLRNPGTNLETALDGNQSPFCQVLCDEFRGSPPCDNINKIGLFLSRFRVLGNPINGHGKPGQLNSVGCVLRFRIFCKTSN